MSKIEDIANGPVALSIGSKGFFRTIGEPPRSRFAAPVAPPPEAAALLTEINAKAAELEALIERARDLRYPLIAAIGADVQLDATVDFITEPQEVVALEPGELLCGASLGTDYFGEGLKALETAVFWTAKGLTAS
ncbi:hypothetical protein ABNQ39_11455 [Azospirillum sp. A26]|uniref:hypothetical protein n=1 Tax=Azospirillum sp. A26 TaxID=3160607 RepID=UPI00366EC972